MNNSQTETLQRLRAIAHEHQLASRDESSHVEFRNYMGRAIFSAYHKRLDARNSGGIEIAIGLGNLVEEKDLASEIGRNWCSTLQGKLPPARPKSRWQWPRVALLSAADVDQFQIELGKIYTSGTEDDSDRESRFSEAPSVDLRGSANTISATPDEKVLREIWTRRGQKGWRAQLLEIYDVCVVTGCAEESVLEAAHIVPFAGDQGYSLCNGLILRSDIHTLFDLLLLSINPSEGRIVVAQEVHDSYRVYDGQPLAKEIFEYVDPSKLMAHFRRWEQRQAVVGITDSEITD